MDKLSKVQIPGELTFYYRTTFNDLGMLGSVVRENHYGFPQGFGGITLVDIGAHIGGASVLCASRGARVFSYEPWSESYNILVKNIKLNGLGERIHPFKLAVGKARKTKLFIHSNNTGSNSLYLNDPEFTTERTEEVEVVPLSKIVKDNKLNEFYLKMDCEVAEIEILPEILGGLYKQIPVIYAEIHIYPSSARPSKTDDILAGLVKEMDKFYNKTLITDHEFRWIRK